MASIASKYKYVLHDIFKSEELKIDSKYSNSLKKTVQEICEKGNDKFKECFLQVQEDVFKEVTKDSTNKEEHCFRKLYLILSEKLPKAIENCLPSRDSILWQVSWH